MATLNSEVKNPLTLVQIGVAAPALITSYLSGAVVNKNVNIGNYDGIFINLAYADQFKYGGNVIKTGGFFGDVFKGVVPGLGQSMDDQHREIGRPLEQPFAADRVLSDAIAQTQDMITSMSEGCSGGSNGVPPVSWGALQVHGNAAVNAFSDAKKALTSKDTTVALEQVHVGMGELDALIVGVHGSCSGGAHGEDPVFYSKYQETVATVKAKLEVLTLFLKD